MGQLARASLLSLALAGGCATPEVTCEDMRAWREARGAPTTENPRGKWVETAQACLSVGTSRGDVLALLGEPDITRPSELEYDLGASGFRIDAEALVIQFDARDRVAATRIKQY